MSRLGEIKRDIEACRTYNFGMTQANRLAHEDADKLVAANEAVQELTKVLDKIQREDNVSKNACAGAVADEIRNTIEAALNPE